MNVLLLIEVNLGGQHMTNILGGSCPDVKICFAEKLMNVLLFIEVNSRGQHMTNVLGGSCPDVKYNECKFSNNMNNCFARHGG